MVCSFALLFIMPHHILYVVIISYLLLVIYICLPYTHLSAPAHDNILLMRTMWNGWRRILKWKASLPIVFTMYLLAQMRPASSASDDSCSHSSETRWMHRGNSSTPALFLPKSKIRILGSVRKQDLNLLEDCSQSPHMEINQLFNNAIVGYKCHLRLPTTVNSTVKRRNHIYRLVMSHTDIAYYNSKARFR